MKRLIFISLSLLLLILIPGCVTVQNPPVSNPAKPVGQTSVIGTFSSNPTAINPGGSSTLIWNVTGANSVSIDQGIGTVNAVGSIDVSPSENTVYTLTAENLAGDVTSSVTINMTPSNNNASLIRLTPADVMVNGWVLEKTNNPMAELTTSSYSITFIKGDEVLTNTVFVYQTPQIAENHFYLTMLRYGASAQTMYSLGEIKSFVASAPASGLNDLEGYFIGFVKKNVFVEIGTIYNYKELEAYSKLMLTRIQ